MKARFSLRIGITKNKNGRFYASSCAEGDGWLLGNVNIENRIYTDSMVRDLGNGEYVIWALRNSQYCDLVSGLLKTDQDNTIVTATIDGKSYSGVEIYINGINVVVNDSLNMHFKSEAVDQQLGSVSTKASPQCAKTSHNTHLFFGGVSITAPSRTIDISRSEKTINITDINNGPTIEGSADDILKLFGVDSDVSNTSNSTRMRK